ncbi:hypothetical protein PHLCEN_2v11181 [Hermanssonia centrifuga]|uniref:Uncharacterized protein n=1 Tax=Hermanssonia centrifuga TaxID=98765 RepID=A0A2R6NKP5_9APHY|nr:hypothetical protein PHLCEN_2v11181 [Hermanssonia centrifuga]
MPSRFGTSSLLPCASPPPGHLRLKPFSETAFFASLKTNGSPLPFKSNAKRKEFYERWLRTKAFGVWIAGQEEVVNGVLAQDISYSANASASHTSLPKVSLQLPSSETPTSTENTSEIEAAQDPTSTIPSEEPSAANEDVWKADYEAHVAEWRVRSAHQRQKSEIERAKWEALRAEEEKEGKDWGERVLKERKVSGGSVSLAGSSRLAESSSSVHGWENVRAEGVSSPSPADVRDLVAGEAQKSGHIRAAVQEPSSTLSSPPVTVSNENNRPDSEPESSKQDRWEDIPSELTSSYPSINFPSDIHSPSSSHQHQVQPHEHHEHGHIHGHPIHHRLHHHDEPQRGSATSAVFDTSLSRKTRVLALLSSLAINMMLPFVNGVMLGFGELFAKHVVLGWFGWNGAGRTAANVGLRSRPGNTTTFRRGAQ